MAVVDSAPEIYEIVVRVAELMVTSLEDSIRKICSEILLQFLLNYQLSGKRMQQRFNSLILAGKNKRAKDHKQAQQQFLAAFIISFIGTLAVIGFRGALPVSLGSLGLVGLALSYAASVVSLLGNFLSSFTETEKEMVAVQRVIQHINVPQEDFKGSESLHPGWPFQGKIEFSNVTLKYLPSLPTALKDITSTISAGTQEGVIGRTGAGKSSILNALFRLSPICGFNS